jgi:prolyl 4-hydroxylase
MITIIDKVLTIEECGELIQSASAHFTKTTTLGSEIDGYRTADGCWLERSPLVDKLSELTSNLTGYPIENQESVHIVKYDIGGEYKVHHDFFSPDADYYESHTNKVGQRLFSCLFYLNDDYEGGETEFPIRKLKVTPSTGRVLLWSNLTANDELDYDSLHAGLPVISGTKYIAIIWVRENKFRDIKPITIQSPIVANPNPIKYGELENLLSIEECERFANLVIDAKNNNQFQLETDERYYNKSHGGNIDEAWELLNRFLPLMQEKTGRKLKNANPYIRVYKNESTLKPHVDRVGLDWTISLCIFSNIKTEWPLKVKIENGEIIEYKNVVGNGSYVAGAKLEHWREPLKCDEDEYVIQLFLHYTEDCGCR